MAAAHHVCGGLLLSETHTDAVMYTYRVKNVMQMARTKFQDAWIVDLYGYGKALFLDKKIQSALLDEYMFHEPMVQPGMFTHPNPQRVLVAGGGEGATLREVLRHNTVKEAVMVDIDDELVAFCKQWMPEWHQGSFDDPRTTLIHDDARKIIAQYRNHFDVIVSDLTDPLEAGPSQMLFTKEFYQLVYDALTDDGVLTVQSGAGDPLYPYLYGCIVRTLQEVFPVVRPYWCFVASFMLPWGFVLASKKHDPLALTAEAIAQRIEERGVKGLRYYDPFTHFGMFAIPPYLREVIAQARVLTDAEPFNWEA
ncbi:MAG: fused MFS/spermidine synthase [Armatimonadetes bacterium]|nr:fused MFS/spermidine synthase [Armatimonadota bacterium]CUU37145.1 spermidine synthase [Armatimonadetes bacterium DC]